MRPFEMHRVDRVLLALEPVARDLRLDDLAEAVLPREEFPIRHQGPRLGTEISPEKATQFFDRIGLDADLVAEARFRMRHVFVGLCQAPPVRIVQPAVIVAAQPARLDKAVAQIGTAMPAVPVEKPVAAAEILVEDEVFAHQPYRLGAGLGELAGAGDRPPLAPQQFAHRRPRAGLAQSLPAAARFVLYVVGHFRPPRPPSQGADHISLSRIAGALHMRYWVDRHCASFETALRASSG